MPSRSMCLIRASARTVFGALALLSMVTSTGAEEPTAVSVPGQPVLLLGSYDLASLGYATGEFFVSGTASSYKLAEAPTEDGHWNAEPAETAPYTTRIVVVRPTDPERFSGTVVVEWLNVSGGADGSPDWNMTHREIVRRGHAYVAVSAQRVGVEGGRGMMGTEAAALKQANPERYGRLSHPGDAFSYDIYSQAGRLVKAVQSSKILGPLVPKHVIAIGESQSAVFLTTYLNAVDPIAKAYDGFLIHSRFGSAAALDDAGMNGGASGMPRYVKLRTDLRAPMITVITETDMLDGRIPGFNGARQPDNERLRVWEVAGTAHADNYTFSVGFMDSGSAPIEKLAAAHEATADVRGMQLAKPMNNAPQHHYVMQAALWHLDRWIAAGEAPPKATPLTLASSEGPRFAFDANGNAEGGVRTPWVDVPTSRLSGAPNSGGALGFLVGSSEPFDAATLNRLYPGGQREYLEKFEASLDSAITLGFILPADRQEILDLAAFAYRGAP